MERIYTGGGITFYIVELSKNDYLLYENGDDTLVIFDTMYDFDWDYDEELKHVKKEYEKGSKEYDDIINKYFKDVYRK